MKALTSQPWHKMARRHRGDVAERVARGYLEERGYTVLSANFRSRSLELDLICRQRGVLVFVEVRSATDPCFLDPLESLSWRKCSYLVKSAREYLRTGAAAASGYRFDLVVVRMKRDGTVREIELLENIIE